MWSPPAPGARCAGAGDPRSSLECVSRDRGGGGASLAMPGMRGAGRKDRATTVQGAIKQAVRRDRGGGLRKCRRQSGGAAFPLARDHGARRGRRPPLRKHSVAELVGGKTDRFLAVVSNLKAGEPLWFGKERKKET